MAGSCEISNIFSNYISAMYQPDEALPASQPPAQSTGRAGGEVPRSLSLADKPEWFSELPYFWTKVQVLEWISYHVEKNKYDASSIDFSCCNMDGHALCHCTRDQMRLIFGPLGDELYDRLHEISECPKVPFSSRPGNLKLEAGTPPAQDPVLPGHCRGSDCLQGLGQGGRGEPGGSISRFQQMVVRALSLCLLGPVMSHSPNSQDSGGSDLDLDPAEAKLFPDGELLCRDPQHLPCYTACFPLPAPRGTHLWEFIRDILIHPELNEGLMKWEDRREGVFKFLRSEAVAQLWGQKKKNSSMTYEKLSRAMRYYYKREILERVDGRRLVYKFGKNSSGWKEEEVLNRNKEL
uniref:E74 like ETS transcription factor 3 n=1 Tax=Strix occidentalis caurina TaxID=311401 RepID=A0A8D0EQ83_STROC